MGVEEQLDELEKLELAHRMPSGEIWADLVAEVRMLRAALFRENRELHHSGHLDDHPATECEHKLLRENRKLGEP